jgi:hypothetical protein
MSDINWPTKYPIYYKVCPRGFGNEVTYIAVFNAEEKAIIDAEYADYESDHLDQHGYSTWTNDRAAMIPGRAVPFRNRND